MSSTSGKEFNPGPLGLSAFAMSSFVYSMFLIEALGVKIPQVGLGLALFYGGSIQVLAGIWEMKNGNTFGATAFCSYGGFWISFGFIFFPSSGIIDAYKDNNDMFDNAIGIYFIGWTIYTFLLLICSIRTNIAMMSVFFTIFVSFVFLDAGKLTHDSRFDRISGGFGVFAAFIAWYMVMVQLLEPPHFITPLLPIHLPSGKALQEA